MKYLLTLFFSIIYCLVSSNAATNKVICYYSSWASYYDGDGQFNIEDIDVSKCTHINYAFAGLNEDGTIRIDDEENDIEAGGYQRVNDLKKQNPDLKVLISVGGWSEGSEVFSHVAADSSKKNNLLDSALNFIHTYGFDGIDIDWEYPGQRGGTPDDKENFIDLLWVLRNGFNNDNTNSYLITVAVSSNPDKDTFNVNAISNVVDFINVMTYDFHSSDDGQTGQNSPLYGSSITGDYENCVDTSISNWLSKGADAQKLILGLGFYGHSYRLSDPNNNGLGAPSDGPGNGGPFLNDEGYLGYNEICINDWTEVWDDEQQVPYKYHKDQWVGYDNERSIVAKVNYAKEKNLGGVMMWSIDTDDKHAYCGNKNGLLTAIVNNL